MTGERLHGDGIERCGERAGNLVPSAPDALAGNSFAGHRRLQQRGVHSLDDIAQGDEAGGSAEEVATRFAAATFDKASAAQVVEDLDEKIRRHGFALREVFETCKSSPVVEPRELGHRPAGIFQFLRDLHE